MRKRSRFRETLWFKQGGEPAPDAPDPTDLPIEDRYLDDGTVTQLDTREFGVHVGTTQAVQVITLPPLPEVPGRDLAMVAAELRRLGSSSRIAIGAFTAVAVGLLLFLAL